MIAQIIYRLRFSFTDIFTNLLYSLAVADELNPCIVYRDLVRLQRSLVLCRNQTIQSGYYS